MAFVFYTNFGSAKGREIAATERAAFVLHWKSLQRQIRVRGRTEQVSEAQADAYYASRSLQSRLGAWASDQSQPLTSRAALMAEVAKITASKGPNPARPPHWGGIRIVPTEMEFWADGAFRLHDSVPVATGCGWCALDSDASQPVSLWITTCTKVLQRRNLACHECANYATLGITKQIKT